MSIFILFQGEMISFHAPVLSATTGVAYICFFVNKKAIDHIDKYIGSLVPYII